jgi:hypothetical protein
VIDAGSTQSISPDNCGILQADAYAGFGDLYREARKPIALTEALCWAHGRGNFFKLAQLAKAPLAIEAVRRTDAIFDLEHTIIGLPHEQRRATRQDKIAPLVTDLENWMRDVRRKMSRHTEVAKAIDYMLKRWASFSRFLDEGRICLTNNAAERALRGIGLGRKAWLFAGSDRGGERAAAVYSLTVWEHTIRIERITDAVPGIAYPRLTEATGRCPPEDVGGPWGYHEFLDAIADPSHEERLQWIGSNFDPADTDADALAQAVDSLAKKWIRKPAARKRT